MARYEFKLPDIGEGIAEAEIVAWHVKVGDTVEEDQQLADMMTDKATVEMESPVAGKVLELAGEVGDLIAIGSVLVVIETEGADRAAEPVDRQPGRAAARRRRRARRRPSRREEIPGRGDAKPNAAARSAARVRRRSVEPEVADERSRRRTGPRLARGARSARAISASTLAQVKAASDRIRHADLDAYLLYNGGSVAPRGARRDARGRDDQGRRPAPQDRREHGRRRSAASRTSPWSRNMTSPTLEETRAMMNGDRGANPKLTLLPFLITAMSRGARRLPDDQCALRRRGEGRHPPRRGPPGHGDADRTG